MEQLFKVSQPSISLSVSVNGFQHLYWGVRYSTSTSGWWEAKLLRLFVPMFFALTRGVRRERCQDKEGSILRPENQLSLNSTRETLAVHLPALPKPIPPR